MSLGKKESKKVVKKAVKKETAPEAEVTKIGEGAVTRLPAKRPVSLDDGGGNMLRRAADAKAVRLGGLEQFITQLLSIERQSQGAAVKAAVFIGEALNVAKPLLKGEFVRWAADRFPEIGETRQRYYRLIANDFRAKNQQTLKLPDYRDGAVVSALVKLGSGRGLDRLVDDYIGERSMTELLYDIGARKPVKTGGFCPDVTQAANFIRDIRPDLEGTKTQEWDADAIRQFCKWSAAQIKPTDQAKLNYDAAKAAFDHALRNIAGLINGSTPKYQRLSGAECAEVAKQLRAFADIVSRCAKAAKPDKKQVGPKI